MAVNYVMYGGTGLPGAYQSIGLGAVTDSVFVTGGEQELTQTYGFRGAFTHNWDPYWNTASTVLGLPFGITATPRALSATAFLVESAVWALSSRPVLQAVAPTSTTASSV